MSLLVSLRLKNKKVLIVGGGNVACRKVKQLLLQEANITVIAPEILSEIITSSVKCIHKVFDVQDLDGFFLVYAATDDYFVNEQIVQTAESMNILCGSATECEKVSFTSLQQKQLSYGQLAVSTQGLAPAMTKEMLVSLEETWKQKFEKRLELLSIIKEMLPKTDYRKIRKTISKFPYEKLVQVHKILIKKRVIVYLYHGGTDEMIIRKDIPEFLNKLHTNNVISIACLCAAHAQQEYELKFQEQFTLREIQLMAENFKSVIFQFELMMVQEGKYYQRLSSLCSQYGEVLPFWLSAERIENYVSEIVSKHINEVCVFVMHNKNERFQSICHKFHAVCLGIKDEIDIENRCLHVIPVFMTKGTHMKFDVLYGESAICERLKQKGNHVLMEEKSLIEQDWVIQCFQKHIR